MALLAQRNEIKVDTVKCELYLSKKNNIPESAKDYLYDSRGNLWHIGYKKRITRVTPNYMQTFDFSNSDYIFQAAHCVYEDEFNELWIGTDRGIARFDFSTERFTSFATRFLPDSLMYYQGVKSIHRISKELMMIGTGFGYFIYDLKYDEISSDNRDTTVIKNTLINKSSVKAIEPNLLNREEIFVYLGAKLRILNWQTGLFTDYPLPTATEKPRDAWAMGIFQFENALFIPVGRKKVWKFDLVSKEWIKIPFNFEIANPYNTGFHKNTFLSTYRISERYFALNSRRAGVLFYDMQQEQFKQLFVKHPEFSIIYFNENKNNTEDRYLNFVNFTYVDHEGYFWANHTSRHLVRSSIPILNVKQESKEHKVELMDIKVNGRVLDSLSLDKSNGNLKLQRYERNASFGLKTNFSIPSSAYYMYKLNNGDYEKVKRLPLQLKELNPGENEIELRIIDNSEVLAQTKRTIEIKPYWHERFINRLLLVLLILLVPTLFYLYRLRHLKKLNEEKISFDKKVAEMEMTVLKAQMNPHFLFNSLNSIKYYAIAKSKNETADYINTFSKLIRQVLRNSDEKLVSLSDELEALRLYLEVESRRFEKNFSYKINVAPTLNADVLQITPLLIQPYVENAIWHGILHKENGGYVTINVNDDDNELDITIEDNGVGRKIANEINQKKKREKSFGTKITQNRIKLIKEVYDISASISTTDLYSPNGEALGTKVKITFPKLNNVL
jgi:two-component sensor histidine kinase